MAFQNNKSEAWQIVGDRHSRTRPRCALRCAHDNWYAYDFLIFSKHIICTCMIVLCSCIILHAELDTIILVAYVSRCVHKNAKTTSTYNVRNIFNENIPDLWDGVVDTNF